MHSENYIKGNNEEEIWQQINEQFKENPEPLNYTAIIEQGGQQVIVNIDIDLGGGFEGGYATTSFTAPINHLKGFKFAIHEEHFTDEIGKFFGMQDVVIGYEEFDKKLIVKTNNEAKVKQVFASDSAREFFQSLQNFTLGITTHHTTNNSEREPFLELTIETGITDVAELRRIYQGFYAVLNAVKNQTA